MTHAELLAPPPEHDPSPDWGQSLSNGAAGIALLHIAYAHTGIGGWDTAHQWVTAMTRSPVVADPDACGLFRGAPAVAFVLRVAARPEYTAALRTLDGHIATLTRQRLDRAHERIERRQVPQLREYDLISGLTGIGVYLLHQPNGDDLLQEVLSYLVRLAVEPVIVDGQRLPGWWTGNGPADQPAHDWPGGHCNLGLAHGIAGPLALLASALTRGVIVTGQVVAVQRICAFLDQWRCGTRSRPWWPGMISPNEWTSTVDQPGPQRPSWCYGTPGLARAQQLAALALGDPQRQRYAEDALAGCLADVEQLAQLGDVSLCHGWAGLVQTARRAAADAGPDSELAALLPHLHTCFEQHLHGQRPSCDGMLEGTAGIALTRQAIADDASPASRWDACLLVAPPTLGTMHTERNGMTATTDTRPEGLRNRMVDHIREAGHLHSGSVEQALRTVPRHLFLPMASIEDAYANKSITTKPGGPGGRPASCASVPTVMAMMLGQLDAQPGDRVLEIGAGTGYNAALLAELVGESGEVTTVDIYPDVTEQARRALDANGYGRVRVLTGDGALGAPDQAPFDRIIVTVGPWDLPPAWHDQLALEGGCLVVPLHWRGQARSVAFVHEDGVLRASDSQLCGFIPMIGDGQDGERTGHIGEDVALYWDRDQRIDPAALHGVLAQPGTTVWSGASVVPNESTDPIWLRLTGTEPGTCRFAAEPAAVESGLCNPAFTYRSPALVDGDSLAYLTLRGPDPEVTERRWELGAIGHGPAGTQLADRLCEQIRAWGRDRTAQPVITAYPSDTADQELAEGLVIDKHHVRLVVSVPG